MSDPIKESQRGFWRMNGRNRFGFTTAQMFIIVPISILIAITMLALMVGIVIETFAPPVPTAVSLLEVLHG